MGVSDPTFGRKLAMLEAAIGFRFAQGAFSNGALARELGVTDSTMSRKKSGARRVTQNDWSRLARRFELDRFDLEPSVFGLDVEAFEARMRELGRRALADRTPAAARKSLHDLAANARTGGRVTFDYDGRPFCGGIGTDPEPAPVP